jgi:hypothetical protein
VKADLKVSAKFNFNVVPDDETEDDPALSEHWLF